MTFDTLYLKSLLLEKKSKKKTKPNHPVILSSLFTFHSIQIFAKKKDPERFFTV